ncbi:hypothetical protein AM232_15985 [Bacillus sp. FJAT-21352]|nr:hypothetical protein AM232_15985 [Bacillus sp. FJAT-21352]
MTKNKFITFEEAYEKRERSKKIFIGSYITIILILIVISRFDQKYLKFTKKSGYCQLWFVMLAFFVGKIN